MVAKHELLLGGYEWGLGPFLLLRWERYGVQYIQYGVLLLTSGVHMQLRTEYSVQKSVSYVMMVHLAFG